MANPGYLYILSNPSYTGQVKIGKTERHPNDRRKELSAATGVPTPFEVRHWAYFNDCDLAETKIHEVLAKHGKRISGNKEFFRLSVEDASEIMDKLEKLLNKDDANREENIKESLKSGFKWLNGDEGTLKDENHALEYFEQASAMGDMTGAYMSGIVSEKISSNQKRKSDKKEFKQRALNHYQLAINKGHIKALAKASWIFRTFEQHNEANQLWNDFLTKLSEEDSLDKESTRWVLRWLDNKGEYTNILPEKEHPLWKKHKQALLSACNPKTTPKGKAAKLLKSKGFPFRFIPFELILVGLPFFIGVPYPYYIIAAGVVLFLFRLIYLFIPAKKSKPVNRVAQKKTTKRRKKA